MKSVRRAYVSACLLAGLLMGATAAFAHDPSEGPVALEPEALSAKAGRVRYEFQLVDTKTKTLVTDKELNTIHERKLHFLAYDPALKEFQHVHPVFGGALWTVDLDVAVDGSYFVWAQGELAAGNVEFAAGHRLSVSGGRPAWPAPPALKDARSGVAGISRATLSATRLKAKQETMLTLALTRTDGSRPDITPYLGAFAHVIAVPDDGDALLHVHPMSGAKPSEGMVHLTFPAPGFYRVWVQFMDGGQLRLVPLSVQVF